MTIIGIDFSINSPGICVYNDAENTLKFISVSRFGVAKKDFFEQLQDVGVHVSLHDKYKPAGNLSIDSQGFTQDSINHANLIKKAIKDECGPISDAIIVFEGFSFGSSGNRLAQLAGYQYISREKLINEFSSGDMSKLYVYAPQTVKSVAGASKRGQGKVGMIESFLNQNNCSLGISNNGLWKEMTDNDASLRKNPTKKNPIGDFRKPIDDLIDSYWIVRTYIEKELNKTI